MRKLLLAMLAATSCAAAVPATAAAVEFKSPTGKIKCSLGVTGAACYNVMTLATAPPAGSTDCGSGASAASIDRRGARLDCIGNPYFTNRKLAYGASLRRGNYVCTSRESGMTCRNRVSKRGFTLKRDGWRFF